MWNPLRPLLEGYDFIARECQRRASDAFEARLGPLAVTCMRGPDAAAHFYSEKFERAGPAHWRGRRARSRTDRWAAHLVEQVRTGAVEAPAGRALHAIGTHRTLSGQLLDPTVPAVELINVLRPTVAIDRYVAFAALALAEQERAQPARQ